MVTTLLSFGLEQVVVRRIAASKTSDWAAAAFFFHALAGSVLGFLLMLVLAQLLTADESLRYLPWFFLAQSITFVGTPLKQFLNAKQQFTPYGVIAFIANIIKVTVAFILIYGNLLSIVSVYIVLIACALIELSGLLWYVFVKVGLKVAFKKIAYLKLLKEASSQYLLVIFDSSLSRIDVILMGLIATKALTGEYSFAYRAFEISRLPIVVIAPIIMAKFAKMFGGVSKLGEEKKTEVATLFSVEMFLAILIPLSLNILWGPVVDWVSKGKYGYSNATEFLILSICIPMQFAINMFWTLAFASKRYKAVSAITIVTAVLNLLLNFIFIPIYGGVGAASVFLFTIIVQVALYYYMVRKRVMHLPIRSFVIFILLGGISYYIVNIIDVHVIVKLILAVVLYVLFSVVLKQIGKRHLITLKAYLKK